MVELYHKSYCLVGLYHKCTCWWIVWWDCVSQSPCKALLSLWASQKELPVALILSWLLLSVRLRIVLTAVLLATLNNRGGGEWRSFLASCRQQEHMCGQQQSSYTPNSMAARRNWRRRPQSSCGLDSQCSSDREEKRSIMWLGPDTAKLLDRVLGKKVDRQEFGASIPSCWWSFLRQDPSQYLSTPPLL